jgi:hypothetical protein
VRVVAKLAAGEDLNLDLAICGGLDSVTGQIGMDDGGVVAMAGRARPTAPMAAAPPRNCLRVMDAIFCFPKRF